MDVKKEIALKDSFRLIGKDVNRVLEIAATALVHKQHVAKTA